MKALLDPSVKKIAVANPEHAPYGQAAVAAMQKESIYEKVKDKFVLGENISQTASFLVSGSAEVGLVYRRCTEELRFRRASRLGQVIL
jgi:molybdate transport system substrate-binding protein